MTKDSTPLNADDELDKYLFDTWNMKETVHNRALANGIKKWHNKQVAAVLDRLEQSAVKYGGNNVMNVGTPNIAVPLSAIETERNKLKEAK